MSMMSEVAQEVGVSVGTVSRAFNGSHLIPLETRIRVMSVARRLGYRPRVGVRGKQVALVTQAPSRSVMGGYVHTMTHHLCPALSRAGAGITLLTEERIEDLLDNWFDGVIGIAWEPRVVEILRELEKVPVVWFSENYTDAFHVLYVDGEAMGREVGRYFLERGHRRLAIIHDRDYSGERRLAGMREAVREYGEGSRLLALPNTPPLQLAVKRLIDEGCTAVWVTGEDLKVLEVSWLLQELAGKRVPEDISLIGFENAGISEFQRPSLTTVATPLAAMAERAVELVTCEGASSLPRVKECFGTRFIERNSVQRLG